MTCQDMQHLMHGYLDGELDLVRNREMEGHLQTCPACAQAPEPIPYPMTEREPL